MVNIALQRSLSIRYYCPGCGMVAGNHNYAAFLWRKRGDQVFVPAHDETSFFDPGHRKAIGIEKTRCPGGAVDMELDRAP